jgi:hypothetical protein
VTRALALALRLCWPGWAAAQSPGWEEILGAADRAWEAGQVEDAAIKRIVNINALRQRWPPSWPPAP